MTLRLAPSRLAVALALLVAPIVGCGSSEEIATSGSGSSTSGGTGGSTTTDDPISQDGGATALSTRWWALLHTNSRTPSGPGVYLFDEPTQTWTHHVPLPPDATSPHGLAFDGTSLWVSSYSPTAAEGRVFELDPETGDPRSAFDFLATQGLTLDGDVFWTCPARTESGGPAALVRVTKAGHVLRRIPLPEGLTAIQDCVFDGVAVYYLSRREGDDVFRVNLGDGTVKPFADPIPTDLTSEALAYDGAHLVVVENETWIDRIDRATGEIVSRKPWSGYGWTTAITAARGYAPTNPKPPEPPK